MNMQQSVLEAISPTEEKIRLEANKKLSELGQYVFPVDANTVESSKIQDRISENKPVDFAWAASAFDGYAQDKTFLVDLAKSILPERGDELLFFPGRVGPTESEQIKYPLISSMNGGPTVFRLFGEILGAELYKPGVNTFETTPDENGSLSIKTRDDSAGLSDVMGKYRGLMERTMKVGSNIISNGAVVPKTGDFRDVVLYAAYLGYIFQCCKDALKQPSETNGKRVSIKGNTVEARMRNLLSRGARNITKLVVDSLPGTSMGSRTNWGSVYNEGKSIMKTIEPSELSNSNLTEIRVYPKYVVDVLRLTIDDADELREILKNSSNPSAVQVCDGLENIVPGGQKQNKVLPITIDALEAVLRDEDIIHECLNRDIGGIFSKHGQNWVSSGSLDAVLSETPRINNSDENTVRAIGITVAPSLKRSNTFRERTGKEIVNQSHIDMTIGEATVVKNLTPNQVAENAKAAKMAGKSSQEWLAELKAGANGDTRKIDADIKQALKYKGPGAEASIAYVTDDGVKHVYKVDSSIDAKLSDKKAGLRNVISRKVSSNGHEYFICIPHGVAFAAMQNEDSDIVRNDNMETLCDGLTLDGNPKTYSSVEDLLNSPIGKYCNAVAREKKTGRIRFGSSAANTSYGKVLNALVKMKAGGKNFQPRPVKTMADVANLFKAILASSTDENDANDAIKPFLDAGLTMSVEGYSPSAGEFFFRPINFKNVMAKTIVQHLSDMYNLDANSDEYDATDVQNVMEAVAPNVWGLDGWNYGHVTKAASAFNAPDGQSVTDEANPSENGDIYDSLNEVEVGGENFERLEDTASDMSGEAEVEGKIGGENIEAIQNAFDSAYEKLFGEVGHPLTVDETEKLKNGVVAALGAAVEANKLSLDVKDAVADIQFTDFKDFVRKFRDVVKNAVEYPTAATKPTDAPTINEYVPFTVAGTPAGDTLVNFCLYKTEGESSANRDELNAAFDEESGAVRNMMDKLLASVPKECLSIDYGTDDNNIARLDAKTPRELLANELSMLESHYAKKVREKEFTNVGKTMSDIYRNGVTEVFAIKDDGDTKSPYSYKGTQIDLYKVKSFFDSLMALASSYNDIGTSKEGNILNQARTQQTINNDVQNQKRLDNQYFLDLKASFDTIYNGLQNGGQITPRLTRVLDKVMRQVVSNPMNVLINNNAKLISAYAYDKEVIRRKRKSLTGFGNSDDAKKGLGVEGYVTGRSLPVDKTLDAMKFVLSIKNSLSKVGVPNGISADKAEADYKEYLDDIASFDDAGDGAIQELNKAEAAAKEARSEYISRHPKDTKGAMNAYLRTKADSIADIKDQKTFFCDYVGDIEQGSREKPDVFSARVAKIRTNELLVLLQNTVNAIMDARPNLPDDYKKLVSKLAAQGELVESDSIKTGETEIIPMALLEKLFNVDAELELANNVERLKAFNAEKAGQSNNDGMMNALKYGRGIDRHPENRTLELVDRILNDKEVNDSDLQRVINGMDKKGNPNTGTNINFNGKLNVVSADGNDIVISTNTKLYNKDKIIIKVPNGGVRVVPVNKVVSDSDKEYTIPNVGGLTAGSKDVKFARFQPRNEFSGYDVEARLIPVLNKLVELYEEAQKDSAVDVADMNKIMVLNELYRGSSAAPVVKSIVSYFAWRASNFENDLTPSKIVFGGDIEGGVENRMDVTSTLVSTIAADLKKYGPDGDSRDDGLYQEIWDILPNDFVEYARKYGFSVDSIQNERQKASDVAKNVKTTSLVMDAENVLKRIVSAIGHSFGYVTRDNVQNVLKNPKLLAKLNLTKEEGDKYLASINGEYKASLDRIIDAHNWAIAEPLVEDYKQKAGDSANFDDAIKYVKDQYDIQKKRNAGAFAECVKNKYAARVKGILAE